MGGVRGVRFFSFGAVEIVSYFFRFKMSWIEGLGIKLVRIREILK